MRFVGWVSSVVFIVLDEKYISSCAKSPPPTPPRGRANANVNANATLQILFISSINLISRCKSMNFYAIKKEIFPTIEGIFPKTLKFAISTMFNLDKNLENN